MKFIYLILLFAVSLNINSQDLTVDWYNTFGLNNAFSVVSQDLDNNGNVFCSGVYRDTLTFDEGNGIVKLFAKGLNSGVLVKLNSEGDFQWAKSFGGNNSIWISDHTIDNEGNIIVTGYFRDSLDANPDDTVDYFIANPKPGSEEIFIIKLDNNGEFIWVKQIGDKSINNSRTILTDELLNIYIQGSFRLATDFDPGPDSFIVTPHTPFSQWVFLLKLDKNGNFNKVITYETVIPKGMIIDSEDLYLQGVFYGYDDFDPDPGDSSFVMNAGSNNSGFILKLDTALNFQWAKGLIGDVFDVQDLVVNYQKDLLIAGEFKGTTDFDPSASEKKITPPTSMNSFILKLNKDGEYQWVKTFEKELNEIGQFEIVNLIIEKSGSIMVNGYFDKTADFDPSANKHVVKAHGRDSYLLWLSPMGNFQKVLNFRSAGFTIFVDAQSTPDQHLYLYGRHRDTIYLEPNSFYQPVGITNTSEPLIVKYILPYTGIDKDEKLNLFNIYPNPSSGQVTIYLPNFEKVSLNVYTMKGQLVRSYSNLTKNRVNMDLSEQSGIYFIEIVTPEMQITKKLILN